MADNRLDDRFGLVELRLFMEELVSNICRFMHADADGLPPEAVQITEEVKLGKTNAFADILIEVPGKTRYIVEVDYGYSLTRIGESLARKYRQELDWFPSISKLVLVYDGKEHTDREALKRHVKTFVPSGWEVELWDEECLLKHLRRQFGVELDSLNPDSLQDVRLAIDRAKGRYAFAEAYENSPLDSTLLWHLGHWRLRELYKAAANNKRMVLPPGSFGSVAVVFADLCGFSGYVRDTRSGQTIRDCMTAFCSKSRSLVINRGGMAYQFLGDAVIGLFGIPDRPQGYVDRAFECAQALLAVGESVTNEWQRQLDREQPVSGCHVGIAMGDLQLLSLRPFSRTHLSAIGDAINVAARLSSVAQSGEIVVSNLVHRELSPGMQASLHLTEGIAAKNVGMIKAWTFNGAAAAGA